MEIVKERSGDFLHVQVSGRLDNHWSEPFEEAIEEMIREGSHHLRLDLSEVNYLSSAGVGALMKAYRDTGTLQGSFVISAASDRVRTVLRLAHLESLLFAESTEAATPQLVEAGPQLIESPSALIDCYSLEGNPTNCHLVGTPGKLTSGPYAAEDATSILGRRDLFAVGLGALGQSYDECRGLAGEFVAAGGSVAYMPTDGTSTPDYMISSGDLVPEIQALYAITFRGAPAYLLRFEARSAGGAVPLGELLETCTTIAATPQFGVAMAVEVSGLVCAALRRSPAGGNAARFDFPAIREWLSFTPEREYPRTSSIVVGIASASPSDTARPFLRPVSDGLHGHFHAAVTAFRALQQGKISIADVLARAFRPRSVLSVVHLLRDNRPIEGAGESEFLRGAVWIFPLASIESGGTA